MPDHVDFPEPRRGGRRLLGLLALNAALLGLLAAVTFSPAADAQGRARGSYLMAAGNVKGAQAGAVWIVDTVNQELIAVTYDPNAKTVEGIGYRDLAADTRTLTASGRPR
jgi:hypothetical protein